MPLWPQRLYYAAIIATCQVNEALLTLDTLQLSRSNVNSVVRSYLSPTQVGVGVGTSLIWAVDQTLLLGESGYARLGTSCCGTRGVVCTSARTIGLVVGAAVVGVAVVSAPERSICVGLGRYSYSKKGTPFLFHRDHNVYVATLFKLLGQASQRHALGVYPTNQVGYKIVTAQ